LPKEKVKKEYSENSQNNGSGGFWMVSSFNENLKMIIALKKC
jgi:hypothetical protein